MGQSPTVGGQSATLASTPPSRRYMGTLRTRSVLAHPGRVDKTGDCRTADAAAKGGVVRTAEPTTGREPCRG